MTVDHAVDLEQRYEMAHWFCERLWGEQEGLVAVMIGVNGYLQGRQYKFTSIRWRFLPWPTVRDKIPSKIVRLGERHDVYVGVLLRRKKDNLEHNAMPGRFCWADLDGPLVDDRRSVFDTLMADSESFSVMSGTRGGRHVYVALADSPEPQTLKSYNHRLARGLGADSGHALNKVLRVPGTFNHKTTARNPSADPVAVLLEDW